MEFKGTQGKWEVFKLNGRFVVGREGSSTLRFIDCWYEGIGGIKTNEEAKANARLISKAPELLKMLNYFVKELDGLYHNGTEIDDKIEESKKLIKEATEL